MITLKEVPQEELNKRVYRILEGIGVETKDHNKVGIEHIQQFAELLIKCEGMTADGFKNLARTRLCISQRYITEYYNSFRAWEVFRTHDKKIVLTDQDNNGREE